MTSEEFEEAVVMAKFGQPYYTRYIEDEEDGDTETCFYRNSFIDGAWYVSNSEFPDEIDAIEFQVFENYYPNETLVTEEEFLCDVMKRKNA